MPLIDFVQQTDFDLWSDGLINFGKITDIKTKKIDGEKYHCYLSEVLDGKTGTKIGVLKFEIPIDDKKNKSSSLVSANEAGPQADDIVALIQWQDLSGNELLTISGLSVPFSEFEAGAGNASTSARYAFWVSLLDGNAKIKGSKGNDLSLEVGAGGKATVKSGKGMDKLFVWHEKDVVFDGGKDVDTIQFTSNLGDPYPTAFKQQLVIDLGKGTGKNPYGGKLKLKNVENVVGTSQADKIIGNNKANIIGDGVYDVGADVIKAKGGKDIVKIAVFSAGGVRADGGKGKDELQFNVSQPTAEAATTVLDIANPGNNTGSLKGSVFKGFEIFTAGSFTGAHHTLDFRGGNAGETVVGTMGADTLNGGGGDDTLDGKGGNDTLIGGPGKDTFLFASLPGPGNIDTIMDFAPGSDKIGIAAFNFEAVGGPGKLAAGKFNALSAQDGNDVILYEKGTGRLYHDPDGLGGVAPVHFATLANKADLKAGDIIVVDIFAV